MENSRKIICDKCGLPIDNIDKGIVAWREEGGFIVDMKILHKQNAGGCDDEESRYYFDKWNELRYAVDNIKFFTDVLTHGDKSGRILATPEGAYRVLTAFVKLCGQYRDEEED